MAAQANRKPITSPDPIFALIAQHREAEKARAKARLRYERVKERIEKKEDRGSTPSTA